MWILGCNYDSEQKYLLLLVHNFFCLRIRQNLSLRFRPTIKTCGLAVKICTLSVVNILNFIERPKLTNDKE